MKALTFWLALATYLALAMPAAFAQNTAEGQIYSMSVTPEEPAVFEQITLSVGVINPSDKTINYKLEILVTREGEIVFSQPSTFTLQPGLGTFVSPNFVPSDIGEFEVVAKLTDQIGVDLKDIQVRKINIVSEIGPFDIAIDSPSDVVVPGTRTPLILTLANMGERATDVQVRVVLECNTQPDIIQEFFVFLFPGAVQDKQIATDTCEEVGPHDISASVIVFNKTWISAVSQIFLNESFIELVFEPPETITVRAGESRIFDVKVTNAGNTPIDNLKILMPSVPSEWLKVTPSSITQTEPDETVLFIINITPPRDVKEDEFTVGVSAAADQVLRRKETKLKIISLEGAEGEIVPVLPTGAVPVDLSKLLTGNIIYIGIGVAVAVGGFVGAMMFRRGRPIYHGKEEKSREQMESEGEKLKKVAEALKKRRK